MNHKKPICVICKTNDAERYYKKGHYCLGCLVGILESFCTKLNKTFVIHHLLHLTRLIT